MKKAGQGAFVAAVLLSMVVSALNVRPAYAAAVLDITPITWNVVGLQGNDVNAGPDNYPVGVRVCNTGDAPATNLSANFVWDSANANINLRGGSLNPILLSSLSNVAPNNCHDFYFEVTITRTAAAFDTARAYHIIVTADGGVSATTPANREIYVENLINQNRNSVTMIYLDGNEILAGGTMNLNIGQTYTIQLVSSTATNGYEQISSFINFPNTIFLINSVTTSYTANSDTTAPQDLLYASKLYADGCSWINDTTSPIYRSCTVGDKGKYGGIVTITYSVTIVAASGSTGNVLNTLIYDYSGSSYHYNTDYSTSARIANIIDPDVCVQEPIAEWTFPNNGATDPMTTDNAVGTPTRTATGLSVPSDVTGNPTRAANYTNWNITATLDTATDFVQFAVSTEGYYNIHFSYDVYRSSQGPTIVDTLFYDGNLQNPAGTDSLTNASQWYTISKDYSANSTLDDYSGAYFRIYGYSAGGTNGTMRVDNVKVHV